MPGTDIWSLGIIYYEILCDGTHPASQDNGVLTEPAIREIYRQYFNPQGDHLTKFLSRSFNVPQHDMKQQLVSFCQPSFHLQPHLRPSTTTLLNHRIFQSLHSGVSASSDQRSAPSPVDGRYGVRGDGKSYNLIFDYWGLMYLYFLCTKMNLNLEIAFLATDIYRQWLKFAEYDNNQRRVDTICCVWMAHKIVIGGLYPIRKILALTPKLKLLRGHDILKQEINIAQKLNFNFVQSPVNYILNQGPNYLSLFNYLSDLSSVGSVYQECEDKTVSYTLGTLGSNFGRFLFKTKFFRFYQEHGLESLPQFFSLPSGQN